MVMEREERTLVVGRHEGAGGLNSALRHQYFRGTGVHSPSSASRGTADMVECASSLHFSWAGGRNECSGRPVAEQVPRMPAVEAAEADFKQDLAGRPVLAE